VICRVRNKGRIAQSGQPQLMRDLVAGALAGVLNQHVFFQVHIGGTFTSSNRSAKQCSIRQTSDAPVDCFGGRLIGGFLRSVFAGRHHLLQHQNHHAPIRLPPRPRGIGLTRINSSESEIIEPASGIANPLWMN